jgi:uncharacterized protein (DUF362 family)
MPEKLRSLAALGFALALCLAPISAGAATVKPLPEPAAEPIVGIGRGGDYQSATRTAIENAGGLAGIVKKGDVVLIKPNLCTGAKPDDPKTTDYRVVATIVDMLRELGPSRIIIAEGCFYGDAFSKAASAQSKYDSIKGVEFYNFNACEKKDCYELQPPKSLIGRSLFIPKVFMDADVVIEVPKLKTHFIPQAVVSLTLKNTFGIPSEKIYGGYGDKSGLHGFPLSEVIVDLNKIRMPDFAVIDGVVGGEGYGPVYNTPVKSEIVLAGRDPVALDTVALTFMGFTLNQVPHVKLAASEKLGNADLSKIKVVGAKLDEIKMDFKSSFKPAK